MPLVVYRRGICLRLERFASANLKSLSYILHNTSSTFFPNPPLQPVIFHLVHLFAHFPYPFLYLKQLSSFSKKLETNHICHYPGKNAPAQKSQGMCPGFPLFSFFTRKSVLPKTERITPPRPQGWQPWLRFPSAGFQPEPAHSGQTHRRTRRYRRSWNEDRCYSRQSQAAAHRPR